MQDKLLSIKQNLEILTQQKKIRQSEIKNLFQEFSQMSQRLEQCQIEQEQLHIVKTEQQLQQFVVKEDQSIVEVIFTVEEINDFEWKKKQTEVIFLGLDKSSLNELKTFKNPPEVIKDVFNLLEDLLQQRDDGHIHISHKKQYEEKWKQCLNRTNIIQDIHKLTDWCVPMKKDTQILNQFNEALYLQVCKSSKACIVIVQGLMKFSELQRTRYNQLRPTPIFRGYGPQRIAIHAGINTDTNE